LKKKVKPLKEEDIQQAVYSWIAKQMYGQTFPYFVCFSVPNERNSNAYHMAKLKRMGLTPGISDLVLIWMAYDGHIHVLYLELKRKGGKLSPKQKEFKEYVDGVNSRALTYEVAYNYHEAKEKIRNAIGDLLDD